MRSCLILPAAFEDALGCQSAFGSRRIIRVSVLFLLDILRAILYSGHVGNSSFVHLTVTRFTVGDRFLFASVCFLSAHEKWVGLAVETPNQRGGELFERYLQILYI